MPHISAIEKDILSDKIIRPKTPGQLTWVFYDASLRYIETKGKSFSTFCVIVGALVCTVLELYRLRIAKHEDAAILKNGEAI